MAKTCGGSYKISLYTSIPTRNGGDANIEMADKNGQNKG